MAVKQQKFIILDGNAIIHRSFHALPPTLKTKDGKIVNAVYGFASALLKSIKEFSPDYIALTLDRKEPTFRHKKYKEYKAKRIKAPQELYDQIPLIKEIAMAFDIPIYEKAGFEADDLIGTIASKTNGKIEKIIVTGDLDTLQLVDDKTKVYTMSRGINDSVLYDAKAVKKRYGLSPSQIIDYKSLRGDPSDNIPGVQGIGEKTAIELLQNFQTLNNIYKNIESSKIKDRVRILLKKYKNEAYLSKKLATIITDVNFNFLLKDAYFKNFNFKKITKIFYKFEFKSLLPRLDEITKKNKNQNEIEISDKFARNLKNFNYNLIDTEKKFDYLLSQLKKQKEFAFDTETKNFNPITPELLGISFCWKNKEAYYIKCKMQNAKCKDNNLNNLFGYDDDKKEKGIDIKLLKKLKPILENKNIKKIGHNIKYDIEVMESYGIKVKGINFDTRIASYILNPGTRQHNLDIISFQYFKHQKINKKDLFPDKNKKDEINFKNIPLEKLYNYSCEDADFTFRLKKKLKAELEKQKLDKLFYKIEVPLIFVLSVMEKNGVKINAEFLEKKSKNFEKIIMKITKQIHQLSKIEFNINSTKQLREILFEKLKISTNGIKKGKTGFSTSADELKKIENAHPIIKLIQKNREMEKLKNTYIDALPKLINPETKRVHTNFNQTATATGRLSSLNPNLQNIPTRTKEGHEIRKAFIAEKNYKLLSLDYSQIELRLAASMSNDKKMIQAFINGDDIHKSTAAKINQVKLKDVTSEMRQQAKAINFGILYGQGPHGLSQAANITYGRAQEFIDTYFAVFSEVKKFVDKIIVNAKKKGYVETLFKRRRYLPDINSNILQAQKAAERMAVNAPLQGTAADMIKIAMIKIQDLLNEKYQNNEIKMIIQVHDELIFEIRKDLIFSAIKKLKEIMENVVKLKVPIIVDPKVGNNWGEMEKIK
ncbi:MAG: DNA polymerase I [Xanthomonadaceae bacterium]|nr:DNA polymerase I [Rhodospirillaceae bacterium]NIA17975.1 DNA polymerase I [Xanthomonadaceae bacterium]